MDRLMRELPEINGNTFIPFRKHFYLFFDLFD